MSIRKYFSVGAGSSQDANKLNIDKEESGGVKRKKTDDEKKLVAHEYEKLHRSRSFQQTWNKQFPWILHDNCKIYCRPCRSCYAELSISKLPDRGQFKKYSKGTFVIGSTNLKKSSLIDHQCSEGHKLAVLHVKNRSKPCGSTDAEKCVRQLNKSVFSKLENLFRVAHAIGKHNRPFSDYVWMLELDEKRGLNVGKTYRSPKYCRSFAHAISEIELQKLKTDIAQVKFITLLSDGSTDVSMKENEAVYIRFSVNGVRRDYFLSMEHVPKPDANGIINALKQSLSLLLSPGQNIQEVTKKLVCFTADGASVNTGKVNGEISKMHEQWSPAIVMIVCLVHRLELTFKEALKADASYDKVMQLLNGVFAFYHKSPLQREGLVNSFKALDANAVMPTRVGGTRWLSHTLTALEKLWKGYQAIALHLGQLIQISDSRMVAKGKGIQKLLLSKQVIAYAHFLHDVLGLLSKLSLAMQKSDTNIFECHQLLEATKISLANLKDTPGFYLRQVIDKDEFKGQKLQGAMSFTNPISTIDKLIKCFEKRFDHVQSDILGATRVANLTSWPINFDPEFGRGHIDTLVDHFKDVLIANEVDPAGISGEWDLLKQSLYDSEEQVSALTWESINEKMKNKQCHNLLHLIDLLLSLPASSAQCERGFSLMKQTKTDSRNRLNVRALTDVMRISLHSPDISEFEPSSAIHLWNQSSSIKRRPTYSDPGILPPVPLPELQGALAENEPADVLHSASATSCSYDQDSSDDSGADSLGSDFSDDCFSDLDVESDQQ